MEIIMQNTKSLRKELLKQSGLIEKKVAILSGSTIGEIKNILEINLLNNGIKAEFWIGNYNCYYEDSVFGNEDLDVFKPDIIYIHTTNRNILYHPKIKDTEAQYYQKLDKEYRRYEQIWNCLKEKYNCPIIQNNFEPFNFRIMGNSDAYRLNGKTRYIIELNDLISKYANNTEGFYINDINYLAAYCGLLNWVDEPKWYLYKYAMSADAMLLLSESVANIIKSIFGKNKKAIILDLDNTLWGGVIGDDDVDNIELGEETPQGRAFRDFQLYLKDLSDMGILLNVCSKNEYETALTGFNHPSAVLKPSDFVAFEANWDGKNENIAKIAERINLNYDSIVFIDDNPAERELVKESLSGIEAPDIRTPENYISSIDRMGYFEVSTMSADDIRRKEYYQENLIRNKEISEFNDYNDYLKSLSMNSEITAFKNESIARVTQLINKTNQFNFTTKRYSQSEIESLRRSRDVITIQARLEDKYGDNGIVSALIAECEGEVGSIVLWVMSCRVFKRNLELAVFDKLVGECKDRGIKVIRGLYIPSSKNRMLESFYKELGFSLIEKIEESTVWEYEIPTDYKLKNNVIGVLKDDER